MPLSLDIDKDGHPIPKQPNVVTPTHDRQQLIDFFKRNSNTKFSPNENEDLDNVGITATTPIKKGTPVCILPSNYNIGGTITVTADELSKYICNADALRTISKRIVPETDEGGNILSYDIPTAGLGDRMDQAYYLNHAQSRNDHYNCDYLKVAVGQSQGFLEAVATRNINVGEELILKYNKNDHMALKSGVQFVNALISRLNDDLEHILPTSDIEDDAKRDILDHLNTLSVELRPSEIDGVGVFVTESGALLLTKGMNPFELPRGVPVLEVVEFTEEEISEIFKHNASVLEMINRVIDPHWDDTKDTWVFPLPKCGPSGIGMSFMVNSCDNLLGHEPTVEPETQQEDSNCLSEMHTTKDSYQPNEEILGSYTLLDDEEEEEEEEEVAYLNQKLPAKTSDDESESGWDFNNDGGSDEDSGSDEDYEEASEKVRAKSSQAEDDNMNVLPKKRKGSAPGKMENKKRGGNKTTASDRFATIQDLQDGPFQNLENNDDNDECSFSGSTPTKHYNKNKSTSRTTVQKHFGNLSPRSKKRARGRGQIPIPVLVRKGTDRNGEIIGKYASQAEMDQGEHGIGGSLYHYYRTADYIAGVTLTREAGQLFIATFDECVDNISWDDISHNQAEVDKYKYSREHAFPKYVVRDGEENGDIVAKFDNYYQMSKRLGGPIGKKKGQLLAGDSGEYRGIYWVEVWEGTDEDFKRIQTNHIRLAEMQQSFLTYQCRHCERIFKGVCCKGAGIAHEKSCGSNTDTHTTCPHCERTYANTEELVNHMNASCMQTSSDQAWNEFLVEVVKKPKPGPNRKMFIQALDHSLWQRILTRTGEKKGRSNSAVTGGKRMNLEVLGYTVENGFFSSAEKKKKAAKKVSAKKASSSSSESEDEPVLSIPGVDIDKVRAKVKSIVDKCDRDELTVKGVRKMLEEWLDADLSKSKDAVRAIVMEVL